MMTNMVKTSLLSLKIAVTSLLLLTSINALAARCIDVFPTVLSSPSHDGEAKLNWNVALSGTEEGNLDIGVEQSSGAPWGCDGYTCKDSGNKAESLNLPEFKTSNSNLNFLVERNKTSEFLQGNYDKIELAYGAKAHFKMNNNVTKIKKLIATKAETTFIFDEGVYWIEEFKISSGSQVIITDNANVTLIIKKSHFEHSPSSFNFPGTPEQLVLITYDDIKFGSKARFKGFIYTENSVILKNKSNFEGAINGEDIDLGSNAAVKYAPDSIKSANFNGFCSVDDSTLPAPVPKLEYRFDECSYTESAGDVIDQMGHFNGTSNGILAPSNEAVINTSLDLSADNTSDWIDVPSNAVDGLNDFSVSVWFKTSVNKSQQEIFHALGNNTSDDELEIYLKNRKTVYIKVRDESEEFESDIELTDGRWHHLVTRRQNKKVCLFIDGKSKGCSNGVESGILSVTNPKAVVIGQEQDSFGGGFSDSQNFEGQLDEFKIFDEKLSSTQISNIYNNELAGRNYDDFINQRAPESCSIAIPELEYRFDEVSWNGTDDEVNNNLSSGPDGKAYGNTTTTKNTEGQICRAGNFGGSGDYIDVSGINEYLKDSASLSFWIKTNQSGNNTAWQAPGILGVEQIGTGNDIFWGYLDGSGRIGIKKGNGAAAVSSSNVNDNKWHHVVLTRNIDDNVVEVFVDGVRGPNGRVQSESGVVSTTFSSIGRIENREQNNNDNNGISKYFIGQLDELLVYKSVLSQSDVSFIYDNQNNKRNYDGSTDRFCPSEPSIIDHFEIEHDGHGLTCDAESIRIKACTDASCSEENLSTKSVTLDVLADGEIIGSPNFTGSTTVSFNHTTAETLTFTIANSNTTPSNPLKCNGSTGSACEIKFEKAGFRFLYNNKTIIPPQISGLVFGEALQIQAVKDSKGVCKGIFTGLINVNLSQKNITPDNTNPGLSFQINKDTNIAKTPAYTPGVSLNFGVDSIAEIRTPRYNDAGEISLYANYTVALAEGTEGAEFNGVTLSGISNSFWVRPAKLVASAKSAGSDLNGDTATAAKIHAAGDDFEFIVSAYNAADPAVITPNYSPGQIQLNLTRTAPALSDSVDGRFTYAPSKTVARNAGFQDVTLDTFSSGTSAYLEAKYSEVGLFNLDIQDRDYGNAGLTISADAINVGRFTPKYFQQTITEHGHLSATCGAATRFAYSGQTKESDASIGAISYLVNPVLAITAYNSQGNVTENYLGDFMKLIASGVSITSPTQDEAAIGVNNNRLPLTAHMQGEGTVSSNDLTVLPSVVALPKGVLHYEFSDDDNFIYSRSNNALVAPFTADIDFAITSISDTDSVNLRAGMTVDASPAGVEIRFGRLVLQNSFGPEGTDLAQLLQVEHFDGRVFTVSTDNNCLSYDDGKLSSSPDIDTLGGTGTFVSGETRNIQLDAQDADSSGSINVSYDTYDWLEFDWDNIAGYDDPSAIATFGLFRGNDRVIYRRVIN